jgi:hypothetical protein
VQCVAATYQAIGATAAKVAQADTSNPDVGVIYDPGVGPPTDEFKGVQQQLKTGGGTVSTVPVNNAHTTAINNRSVLTYVRSHPQLQ